MRKTVFKNFGYKETQAFAAYLEKMALKGWHFKEWKLGLVFEKGEPRNDVYCVEVFPQGMEEDCRPGEEAEEYGEYCLASGWKLVDGRRKFCIFRRVSKEAVPIVTEREHLENIMQAEKGIHKDIPILWFAWLLLLWWEVFSFRSVATIFSNNLILTKLWTACLCIIKICESIHFRIWYRKMVKRMEHEEAPVIEMPGRIVRCFQNISCPFLYIFWISGIVFSILSRTYLVTGVLLVLFVIEFGVDLYNGTVRPRRKKKVQNDVLSLILTPIIMVVICAIGITAIAWEREKTYPRESAPMGAEDYRTVSGQGRVEIAEREKSILGSLENYYIVYEGEERSENLSYTIYESKYPWVLDYIWEAQMKRYSNFYTLENMEDCTEKWDSAEAVQYKNAFWVRYQEKILVFIDSKTPDTEQIVRIREKLGLTG